jgi:hypothetical protein
MNSREGTREGYYKKMWLFLLEKLTKKYLNCHYVQLDQSAILTMTIYMILNILIILIIIYYN